MKVYNKAFKEEAVKLSDDIGTKNAAEQLGIEPTLLSSWRAQSKKHKEQAFIGSGRKREELTDLEKEVKELRRTNEILKDALAFFASRQKS